MFPSNGKEQWNQLMNRMKVIHDQKASLQKKLDEYTPKKKEDIIPWAREAEALENSTSIWDSGARPSSMWKHWKRKRKTGSSIL